MQIHLLCWNLPMFRTAWREPMPRAMYGVGGMLNVALYPAFNTPNPKVSLLDVRVPCMVQVFFCFPINVSSTRFMIQDQMRIQNTQCDNCLIGTMLICNYLACLCSIFACIASAPLPTMSPAWRPILSHISCPSRP